MVPRPRGQTRASRWLAYALRGMPARGNLGTYPQGPRATFGDGLGDLVPRQGTARNTGAAAAARLSLARFCRSSGWLGKRRARAPARKGGLVSKLDHNRSHYRTQGRQTESAQGGNVLGSPPRSRQVIRCVQCGRLKPRPVGCNPAQVLRCSGCGRRQTVREAIEAARAAGCFDGVKPWPT